jgi:hypothetical protein
MKRAVLRKSTRLISLAILSLLVMCSAGSAQVMQGLDEVNFAGGLFFRTSDGNTGSAFQFDVKYGHFVTDKLEVGTIFGFNKIESVDVYGTANAFLSLHFPGSLTDREVPFLGARIGLDYGRDPTPVVYGVFGGMKIFTEGGGGAYSVQVFYTGRSADGDVSHRYGIENGVSIFF